MVNDKIAIDTFAPAFKEEEGRAIPRRQRMRRKGMPQGREPTASGLDGDSERAGLKQDTPGRPKSASSRQQTQPAQATQSGAAKLDAAASGKR